MSKSSPHPGEEALAELSPEALEAFEGDFHGQLIFPDDNVYDEEGSVWSGLINKYPALITRPTGAADVSRAVDFVRENLPVAVRGGGHNVSGNAVCDGGVVIDLAELNTVRVDPNEQIARAGSGARWFDVNRETQEFGLATPGALISKSGIAGFTLSGGFGHLRRKYG